MSDHHTVDGKGRPIIVVGHRCDPRSDQQCDECHQAQLADEREREQADGLIGRSVWVVLRHFESAGGPEADLFISHLAAAKHAERVSSDAIVREEIVFAETWLDANGEPDV